MSGEAGSAEVARQALGDAAAWIAESIGYPIECGMPDNPMPEALWQALVDHIHADPTGRWHGNTLDREGTESWLAQEAGRRLPGGLHRCAGCGLELDGDDLHDLCDECEATNPPASDGVTP